MFPKSKSSLSRVCSIGLVGSSVFATVLVQTNLGILHSFLAQIWFLSLTATSGMYFLGLVNRKLFLKYSQFEESATWWCGAVGLPCFVTQIMIHNGSPILIALSHLIWAVGMAFMRFNKDFFPTLDTNKLGLLTAGLSTLVLVVDSYKSGNVHGVLGSICLILSQISLTSRWRVDDFTAIDGYFVGMAMACYFYALALI